MPRRLVKNRLLPDPAWSAGLRAAWKKLAARHGSKTRVQDAADVTRMTASRIVAGEDGDASYDTLESVRVAINQELKESVLPPPFIPVRSMAHSRAIEAMRAMDERGQLDRMLAWIDVGVELSSSPDLFRYLLEQLQRRAAAEREKNESQDAIESQGAESGGRAISDGHGTGRHRGHG